MQRIAQNLRLMRELREVLRAFDRAGIAALVLKGAALQATVYRIDERAMADVDLLVDPRHTRPAAGVLKTLGLEPIAGFSRPLGVRWFHSHGYYRSDGVQVDLHDAIAPVGRWRVDTAALFERALPCDFDGFRGRRLANEDMVLHLALNLAKDELANADRCAEDLHRLIAGLIIDWAALEQRAGQWGCRVALWLALELSRRRRRTPVPAQVLARLAPTGLRRRWLDLLVDYEVNPPHRLATKGRRLAQAAFVPVMSDWPLDAIKASGRFALIRGADALLMRLRQPAPH